MKAFLVLAILVAAGASPASATAMSAVAAKAAPVVLQLAEADYPIKPSDAALIAQKTVPDSKVLNVKLLPSGEYVVTLKAGGNVQKVMVNATTGATN